MTFTLKEVSAGHFKNKILKDSFAKATDNSDFKRIPYVDWKKIMAIPDFSKVVIKLQVDELSAENCCSTIVLAVDGVDKAAMKTDDSSLGEFLYNQYGSKGEVTVDYSTNTSGITGGAYSTSTSQNYTISNSDYGNCSTGVSIGDYFATTTAFDSLSEQVQKVTKNLNEFADAVAAPINKKENKTMKGFEFDFGPCIGDNIRMSMYGLAVRNAAGEWVSYNKASGEIINVDIMNFDGGKYLFKVPVAIKDIAVGDIVVHNRVPMIIIASEEANRLTAVDVRAGEEKCIIPTRNMFGFDFVTKIVSVLDAFGNAPTADQPFGNLLPFLMAGDGEAVDPLMLMFAMGNGAGGLDTSNPMLLYFLMKDSGKGNDMLPLMLLLGQKQK